MSSGWPIVVVTGANGGVGFGICHRLLDQLLETEPPDARPQFSLEGSRASDAPTELFPCGGLTLIMACRSTTRAKVAREKLYRLIDARIQKEKAKPGYDGHAERFRSNLTIDVHYLDLAVVQTIFQFAEDLSQKYPYVSHLICNAGVASFNGIDWSLCLAQLAKSPIIAVTAPEFYRQNKGEISVDGLGWVWQCNFFGHYVLFRTLQTMLLSSKSSLGSRVIWMSSLEASPKFYQADDWQLVQTEHSYEGSKYQIDLVATTLDRLALQEPVESKRIRHFVVQPGVSSTNISNALIGWFLDLFKLFAFYIARWCGSPHHTIDPYISAISAVHIALVPLSFIPVFWGFESDSKIQDASSKSNVVASSSIGKIEPGSFPVRFGSETGRWGDAKVGLTEVRLWEENQAEGAALLQKCGQLYISLKEEEEEELDSEGVYERM